MGSYAPGVLLIRNIFRLNISPDPDIGVKSSEKADMRKILDVGPPPAKTFAETFQLLAVIPPDDTNAPVPLGQGKTHGAVVPKLTTVSSKVKSPWKPT